jgi:putative transposase
MAFKIPLLQMFETKGALQSMSRKSNCLENGAIESFFGTLEAEFFYLEKPKNIQHLESWVKKLCSIP